MTLQVKHSEEHHVKKMFLHHLSLLNNHHSVVLVVYKCPKLNKMVVGGGKYGSENFFLKMTRS